MTMHVINFVGPITPSTYTQFQDVALKAVSSGASEIRIHMSTDGGNTGTGFALYGLIRSLPIPVVTHNIGNVESMGIIMYLAGTTRLANPHSRFLLHPLNWGFPAGTAVDHARLNELSASLDNDLDRYVNIFNERTDGGSKQIDVRSSLKTTHHILDADAATAAGLSTATAEAMIPSETPIWWINA